MEPLDAEKQLNADPLPIMLNTIRGVEEPAVTQLQALLQFERDLWELARQPEGTVWNKTYRFRYVEYLKGVPAEKMSDGESQLMLIRADKVSVRPVKLT